MGYDSHRFTPGGPLRLGGIDIPFEAKLVGHSDADAVIHALIDALLGACGLGDIGEHFPPSDEQYRGIDSLCLLEHTHLLLKEHAVQILNFDITILTEAPRLGVYKSQIRSRLASALALSENQVSVKAKSNEGMGFIGHGEGLAVLVVALLDVP
jgi:2-C-methyl-D-erythritol 2,4-cyclodiphosphate synthase